MTDGPGELTASNIRVKYRSVSTTLQGATSLETNIDKHCASVDVKTVFLNIIYTENGFRK
jgi:hypothetical protein